MTDFSYIAITLPVKQNLFDSLHEYLKKMKFQVSWEPERYYHFTLRHTGVVLSDSQIEEIRNEVERILGDYGPIPLVLDRLGCFPGRGDNCPLFITCQNQPAQLTELQQRLENKIKEIDKGISYNFSAHMTLGRVKKRSDNTYGYLVQDLANFDKRHPFCIKTTARSVFYETVRFINGHKERDRKFSLDLN